MAVLTSPYFSNSNWILSEKMSGNWTQQENKLFENALAHFDRDTPDRWVRVAGLIPGKTVEDVMSHYQDLEEDVSSIEAGLVPFPGYSSSSFTLDWDSDHSYDDMKQAYSACGKRSGSRLADHERKKGVPWTEEEHKYCSPHSIFFFVNCIFFLVFAQMFQRKKKNAFFWSLKFRLLFD